MVYFALVCTKNIRLSGSIKFVDRVIKYFPNPSQLIIELRDSQAKDITSNIIGSIKYDVNGWRLDRDYKYSFDSQIPVGKYSPGRRFYLTANVNSGWKKVSNGDPRLK